MLSLYSRPDIIWDAKTDFIPEYDRELNAEALLLSEWLCTDETLARYIIQEWSINQINSIERLLDENNPFFEYNKFEPVYLLSTLKFLKKAHALNIYPTKVPGLINEIEIRLNNLGKSTDGLLHALMHDKGIKDYSGKIYDIDINKLFFYSFIFNLDLKISVDNIPNYKDIADGENLERYLYAANVMLNNKLNKK